MAARPLSATYCRERVQQSTGQDARKQTKLGQSPYVASIPRRLLENRDPDRHWFGRGRSPPTPARIALMGVSLLQPLTADRTLIWFGSKSVKYASRALPVWS
jgi:hypothetical protein